jgi:hypothetical protein
MLRSCQSARGSRAGAAGPSRGRALPRGNNRAAGIRTGRFCLIALGCSQPLSETPIGAAAARGSPGGPLLLERGSVSAVPGGRRPGLPLPAPVLLAGAWRAACGQDGDGLGPQELRPGRSDPPRCRSQTAAAQSVRDGRGGDSDAELEQLALDPQVAPPRVLPGQPKDQHRHRRIDRRASWPATIRPFPAHELSAPAVERFRYDRKG